MFLWPLIACCLSGLAPALQPPLQSATRAGVLAAAREAKAAAPPPVAGGRFESLLFKASNERWLERLFRPRTGPFVALDSAGDGSPLGAGPGWTFSPPDYRFTTTTAVVGSVDRSWSAWTVLLVPNVALGHDRVSLSVSARRDVRAEDEYWGRGSGSGMLATYRLTSSTINAAATYHLTSRLSVTAGAAREWDDVGPSRSRFNALFDTHDATTAPGLFAAPSYRRLEVAVDFDQRDTVPSSRTGLHLAQPTLAGASTGRRIRVAHASYHDLSEGLWSFGRTTIDAQQYVAWLHGHRVLAIRALADLTDTGSTGNVPFYLLPAAGGSRVGRADPTFRLRDRHLLALQAEYRFLLNPFMHGALFVDAVEAVPSIEALTWRSIRWTGGLGLRVGTRGGAALRLDLALGRSGARLVLGAGHAF